MIALVEERRAEVGVAPLCEALGLARATFYRRRGSPPPGPLVPRKRPAPSQALTPADREQVLALLHEERFVDLAPAQVYAHLLDEGWTRTRAEQACPMSVFRTIKVEDAEMQRIRAEEGLEVLEPQLGTQPRVYYKNLHLITKCFVGGTVVQYVEGVEECAAGVEVVLEKDGREVGRATTDAFGEFTIDRLEPNTSGYHLKAASPSGRFQTQFNLAEESRYLGVMTLAAG